MDTSKIIKGVVGGGRYTVTAPIVKEDYGLYLKIEGLELPSTYEVDFSNSEHNGTSVTMIGNADGVLIPHQFIDTGKDIFAFLYHVGDNYGRTVFKFRIPNKLRPDRTDEQPTPEEQSTIDQAISALNSAVAQTAQDVIDADASAQSASESAEQAQESARTAGLYSDTAQTYANSAEISANSASASATASANSASQAEQIKTDVQGMVSDAQGYAQASEQSATASANSASQASGYATSASQSASSAQGYASQAQTSAQTASTKASEASTSAQTASAKATESAQSASLALGYKNDAESAKTASQTAQGLAEGARDDSEQIKSDVQDLADGIDTRLVDVEDGILKAFPTDTASGSIASFTDGADDLPLKSLMVDINPIQDLHGQDAPYPAGGGKNKLPTIDATQTINGVTWTLNPDGSIKLTGTATANSVYDFGRNVVTLPSGTYTTLDITVSGVSSVTIFKIVNGTASIVKLGGGVFTLSEETSIFIRYVVSTGTTVNTTIYPQVESGSTATSYAPYSNICPISGWTQVDVEQSGVNVWDEEWELGGINSATGANTNVVNAIRTKGFTRIKPLTSYYNYFGNTSSGFNFQARFYDADKNYIGYVNASGTGIAKNTAFVTPSNAHYLRFQVQAEYGTTYNHDISINYPSTDHDYHPYTGRSITIDLGQTVYGGKLDVLSGELTVYPEYDSYNGETLTGRWISDRDVYASGTTPTIGAQVVNVGAEGTEYQLEPHEVASLLGQNNIFADTGDVSCEYRADTRLYIEKLTQPTEDDMVANSAIASGQFFMVGNSLYRALANIASGATITVGTNAQRVSLADALNLVNA